MGQKWYVWTLCPGMTGKNNGIFAFGQIVQTVKKKEYREMELIFDKFGGKHMQGEERRDYLDIVISNEKHEIGKYRCL